MPSTTNDARQGSRKLAKPAFSAMTAPVKLLALESQIRDEVAAVRAALKTALQHAANVGTAYAGVQDLFTQSQVQVWLAGPTVPADRHTIMTCRRISMCDLDAMARTLGDLMLDAAAGHIAQEIRALSRSEQIEVNRAKLQNEGRV